LSISGDSTYEAHVHGATLRGCLVGLLGWLSMFISQSPTKHQKPMLLFDSRTRLFVLRARSVSRGAFIQACSFVQIKKLLGWLSTLISQSSIKHQKSQFAKQF
jgi:hypothetical protein